MTDTKNRATFIKQVIIDSGCPTDITTALAMIGAATELLIVWEVDKHKIIAMFREYANELEKPKV